MRCKFESFKKFNTKLANKLIPKNITFIFIVTTQCGFSLVYNLFYQSNIVILAELVFTGRPQPVKIVKFKTMRDALDENGILILDEIRLTKTSVNSSIYKYLFST
jgi:hypothetical protein